MDTGDVQAGLQILETKVGGLEKTVNRTEEKVDNLPTSTHIENIVLKAFESHIEKKHKGVDLRMLLPFMALGGTAIGALVLALLG